MEENVLHIRYDGKLCILFHYKPHTYLMFLVSGFHTNCDIVVPATHTPHKISKEERINNITPKKFR